MRFNETKATQTAARFLQLRQAPMSYVKLIKLLYFLDRAALLRWGRPVTTDRYVSMDKGPVVSRILDLITDEPNPGRRSIWREHIVRSDEYEVTLAEPIGTDELSVAEEELIGEIFGQYGKKNRWELVDISHQLPEWKDPEGSAYPIEYEDILQAGGKTADEITQILEELDGLEFAERMFHVG